MLSEAVSHSGHCVHNAKSYCLFTFVGIVFRPLVGGFVIFRLIFDHSLVISWIYYLYFIIDFFYYYYYFLFCFFLFFCFLVFLFFCLCLCGVLHFFRTAYNFCRMHRWQQKCGSGAFIIYYVFNTKVISPGGRRCWYIGMNYFVGISFNISSSVEYLINQSCQP